MSFSYYIRKYVINKSDNVLLNDESKELLDNIYNCCINGNIGVSITGNEYHYKKMYKKKLQDIDTNINLDTKDTNINLDNNQYINLDTNQYINLDTNIKFIDINKSKYDYAKILNEIDEIKTNKNLRLAYLTNSFLDQKNTVLITFDEIDNLHTILTFFYNNSENCIEVDVIWSKPGGGAVMMNFLINAIKCAINKCTNPSIYKRKLILKSIPDEKTIDFYKRFNFSEQEYSNPGLIPFTRELSFSSADLNYNVNRIMDDEEMVEMEKLEVENEKLYDEIKSCDHEILLNEIIIKFLKSQEIDDLTEEAAQYMDANGIYSKTSVNKNIDKLQKKRISLYKRIIDNLMITKDVLKMSNQIDNRSISSGSIRKLTRKRKPRRKPKSRRNPKSRKVIEI